jgi:hypothetical protein
MTIFDRKGYEMSHHTIMIPSRCRASSLIVAVNAMRTLAAEPQQILIAIDDDDQETSAHSVELCTGIKPIVLPGTLDLREKYAAMEEKAHGQMLWYWSDDVFMRTPAWDARATKIYRDHPDKKFICSVKDGMWNGQMALNTPAGPFFLTREWIDAVGYTLPPDFKFQAMDLWLWDVGRRANRRIYAENINGHHAHSTRVKDATDNRAASDFDVGVGKYIARENERQEAAVRLGIVA